MSMITRADQQEAIATCEAAGVRIVVPQTPPPEMKDSVLAGLAYVRSHFTPSDQDAWLLAPADMPLLNAAITNRVLAAHIPESTQIIAPVQAGKRGHPVLFPWPLANEVDELRADEGVNALLKHHSVREIECDDEGIHSDVDTPVDYQRLRET
jgi:molybdenum cofactor cytidylyltransferase